MRHLQQPANRSCFLLVLDYSKYRTKMKNNVQVVSNLLKWKKQLKLLLAQEAKYRDNSLPNDF